MRKKRTLGSTWARRTDGIRVRLPRQSRAVVAHLCVLQYCVATVAYVQCPVNDAESLSSGNPKTNRLMTRNFYHTIPRPRVASRANEQVPKISLLPLWPPPEPPRHPPLPCSSRDPRLVSRYTVTTHLIPAAFPRASPFIPAPASPPDNESKEERGARVQLYASELLSLQAQHGPDNSGTQPRVLWSAVNHYVRKGSGGGWLGASSAHKWFA
jgi:hypothetical protein